MKSSITKLITATAVAALLALPVVAGAQTPPSQPQTQPPATAQPPAATASQPADAAREHLTKAKAALDDVETATLSARQKQQIADVKKRLNTLERMVASNDNASATGAANRKPSATSGSRGNANWGMEIAAIDKTLTALLGAESTTGAPAATGTAGTTASKSKTATAALDETTRTKLLEVRTHLTAFATAMAGGDTAPTPSADPKTEPTATNPASTAPTSTPQSSTPPSTTPPATTAPQPTGTSGTMQTQPPAGTTAQPADEQTARRLLTDARNTLSELTQLPAAAQLTGETRTQVAQLISNFNELITTQSEWRASYGKVNANLTALIGPDPGAADPSNPSGTAGAVGTSGSGTANLDPAIRAKLVDLRRQLSEFEKAAGGGANTATAPSASPDPNVPVTTQPMTTPPSSTPPSTTPPATTPPSSTPPSSTPPSSTPPSSTPPSTTPPPTDPQSTTPAPAAQGTTGTQAAGNADVIRHIAAIEAMLKLEDDSGGLTLTKAQVEQLRAHVAALRQALDKK